MVWINQKTFEIRPTLSQFSVVKELQNVVKVNIISIFSF